VQENASAPQLTLKQQTAVDLLVRDDVSDEAIAGQLGINPVTLYRWKKRPEFIVAMDAARRDLANKLRIETIATKQFRIDAQVKRWQDLEAIRTARKADKDLEKFPGSETGFVNAELKLVKVVDTTEDGGISYREFWAHSFDRPLFDAYLAVEKHIAQETGQWENKLAVEGTLKREYIIIDDGAEIPDDDPVIDVEDDDEVDE
jgi:hypothetical protein